ncbi:Lge1p TDEL_0B01270 [Torulaspora delbrueckii]|uniref:Transcription regulator LGE1 helical region domain-containing protein n=1 Tax=Torulaspora delbrueckii TaxID=4950 RepID=G8ZNR2_TORDE|nr:hypothetical protein TDEL_0B01270 [Torulaspora delbrueckii]CCE90256.1 hypothetical protein TDEL_0B01270 [Torulaspora delbrueckii]
MSEENSFYDRSTDDPHSNGYSRGYHRDQGRYNSYNHRNDYYNNDYYYNNNGRSNSAHHFYGQRYNYNNYNNYNHSYNRRESEGYRGRYGARYKPYPQETVRSGNSTPVQAQPEAVPVRSSPIPKRVDMAESCFYYLTDLDKSTDDPVELQKIRETLREGEQLDRELETHNLKLLKTELELGLLTTQCERDALNVQSTQEKLDSLLMQT